jgi:hypothetical protein
MQPQLLLPPSTAPAFGASAVSTEQPQVLHFAAQTVRLATALDEQEPLLGDATEPAAAGWARQPRRMPVAAGGCSIQPERGGVASTHLEP